MKFLILVISLISLNAEASYFCSTENQTSTFASKHMKNFYLDIASDSIAFKAMVFGQIADPVGGCGGKNLPTDPVVVPQTEGKPRTPVLQGMSQYRPDSKNPMVAKTCFAQVAFYLPQDAASKVKFEMRATWSDTDGVFSPSGGDVITCELAPN